MATKHSSKPRPNGRNSADHSVDSPATEVPGRRRRPSNVSTHMETAISAERRNLQKAQSVLGCLVIALEYGPNGEDTDKPDYSDVARVVRSMVSGSIEQLDSVNLTRSI